MNQRNRKKTKMRKTNIVLFLGIIGMLLCYSCASQQYWKIGVEVPGITTVALEDFKEVFITSFLVEEDTKDFELNRELVDYFSSELGKFYKGKIQPKEFSLEQQGVFKDAEFWKRLVPGAEGAVFLTGTARYTQEIRKAILEKYSRRSDDLSSTQRGLAERKFYMLTLMLYLIDASTGNVLYEREFKETRGYENPNQTSRFAFFDLIQQAQVKLFRNVLAIERVQQRYLISDR